MCDVVENGPSGNMLAAGLNEVIVDSVESQWQGLEEHQNTHDDVYLVDRVAAVPQQEAPEASAEDKQQRHHGIQSGQREVPGREEIATIAFKYLHLQNNIKGWKPETLIYTIKYPPTTEIYVVISLSEICIVYEKDGNGSIICTPLGETMFVIIKCVFCKVNYQF